MLINKFKFRRDVEAYHLGGMGCSIGVVAVGLVRDMLKVRVAGVEFVICFFLWGAGEMVSVTALGRRVCNPLPTCSSRE